ncbi:MAG: hypothetical protein KIT11_05350 [Fimbriimonadaceae bacterium]|nr:hypothetical protein [Fimbriimonadaceae bacterium]QYK56682.1 MAG: hypothetical protein KF733_04170 [Fimbriimonadaceae bacterium]
MPSISKGPCALLAALVSCHAAADTRVIDTRVFQFLTPSETTRVLNAMVAEAIDGPHRTGREAHIVFTGGAVVETDGPLVFRPDRARRPPCAVLVVEGQLTVKPSPTGDWSGGVVLFDGVRPSMAGFTLSVRDYNSLTRPLFAVKFSASQVFSAGGNTWGNAPLIETEGSFREAAVVLADAECVNFRGGVLTNNLGPALVVKRISTQTRVKFDGVFFDSRCAPNVWLGGGVEDTVFEDCNFTVCRTPVMQIGEPSGDARNVSVLRGRVERYDESGKPLDSLDTDLVEVAHYVHGLTLDAIDVPNRFRAAVRVLKAAKYEDWTIRPASRGHKLPVSCPSGTAFPRGSFGSLSPVEGTIVPG